MFSLVTSRAGEGRERAFGPLGGAIPGKMSRLFAIKTSLRVVGLSEIFESRPYRHSDGMSRANTCAKPNVARYIFSTTVGTDYSLARRVRIFKSKVFNEFAFVFVLSNEPFSRFCESANKITVWLIGLLMDFG